jgi:catechol 2,3-dioxygenase-like lactoylglutathione lyase family enzyme
MSKEIMYRLHHFGLLCQDMQKSMVSYQDHFGSQLTSRWYNRGLLDISFLGRGSDATLELVGAPFLPYEEEFIARHGYGINHLSFLVDDAAAAFVDLKSKGVRVAWEPKKVLDLSQCGFYDEDGLLFEVFSPLDPANPMAVSDQPRGHTDLGLDHISILTPDLPRAQKFYTEKLGLKTTLQYLPDGGGFIFMADPCFDAKMHTFSLEIIGPPGLEPREVVMLDKHGACFDHLAYVTDDVHTTWKAVLEKGAQNMDAPVRAYDNWLAWVKDADGNDVEIMNPFPPDALLKARQTGIPVDIA